MDDLKADVQKILARPGGGVEDLPVFELGEPYYYQSANLRDPFRSFYKEEREAPTVDVAADKHMRETLRFENSRNREELEAYELDQIRMVGTLAADETGQKWAIVVADGTVHRVKDGNYMGKNYGKILGVMEDRIDLRELIRDSAGKWQERQASLALAEE